MAAFLVDLASNNSFWSIAMVVVVVDYWTSESALKVFSY
jgi:hypothetical protein